MFEISRRHRFAEDMAAIPAGVEVIMLPSGVVAPSLSVRYRSTTAVPERIASAYRATAERLGPVGRGPGPGGPVGRGPVGGAPVDPGPVDARPGSS